jgi:hypothetical protein
MFVQVIEGTVADETLLREQDTRWRTEVRPGAVGYLGATSGITPEGRAVTIARFDTREHARANSERPEQGAWWAATEPAYRDDVVFYDCEDVDLMMDGGSDAAGFVQVIEGSVKDRDEMRKMAIDELDDLRRARPDILGGLVAWHDEHRFTQVMYFRSEQDARTGETSMADAEVGRQYQSMMDGEPTFLDLRDPVFD